MARVKIFGAGRGRGKERVKIFGAGQGGARVPISGAGRGRGEAGAGQNVSISANLDHLLKEWEP